MTDEEGSVVEVIGISPEPVELELVAGAGTVRGRVLPNRVYRPQDEQLIQIRSVAFDYPFQKNHP